MKKESFTQPITGTVEPLSAVGDEVFAKKLLGPGYAISFSGTQLLSPFAGTVIATFPAGHAFIVRRADGLEVLMHVGVNSAHRDEAFQAQVQKYQKVEAGQVLTVVKPELFEPAQRWCMVVFSNPDLEVILEDHTNEPPKEVAAGTSAAVRIIY